MTKPNLAGMKILIVLLLVTIGVFAADKKDWKTAVLLERHLEKHDAALNAQIYTLDLGTSVVVCRQQLVMSNNPIDIAVGSQVPYSRLSSSKLVVKDEKGKEHKLDIEKETVKPAQ